MSNTTNYIELLVSVQALLAGNATWQRGALRFPGEKSQRLDCKEIYAARLGKTDIFLEGGTYACSIFSSTGVNATMADAGDLFSIYGDPIVSLLDPVLVYVQTPIRCEVLSLPFVAAQDTFSIFPERIHAGGAMLVTVPQSVGSDYKPEGIDLKFDEADVIAYEAATGLPFEFTIIYATRPT